MPCGACRGTIQAVGELPAGLVTFLFTDIEGSTALHQRLGAKFAALIADHDRQLSDVITAVGGVVVKSLGDGLFAAFADAVAAVRAAVQMQRLVADHQWPGGVELRVRMGLHAGMAEPQGSDYVALAVHVAARVMAAAHGGQIVVSEVVRELVGDALVPDVELQALGVHGLRGVNGPLPLHQIQATGLARLFPPLRTLTAVSHDLPAAVDTLIGRDGLVRTVAEALHDGSRLVSLVGTGGIGKSRVAVAAAEKLLAYLPAGAWFIPLDQALTAADVLPLVTSRLGIRAENELDWAAVAHWVGQRQMLLVLDNFEHVLAAAIGVAKLLRRCPRLLVLTTSRERLRLRGESVIEVPPLDGPSAVELFCQRASAAEPAFVLEASSLAVITELCRRLDAIPLSIELAASQLPVTGLDGLRHGLSDALNLLVDGPRDLPARHQALRATIGWSVAQLSGEQREVFAMLSVFRGGFTEDAAGAVWRGVAASSAMSEDSLLPALHRLRQVSLVTTDTPGRYRMLEPIRQYAGEALITLGAADRAAQGHLDWMGGLVAGLATDLLAEREAAIVQVSAEDANLRAALDWAQVHRPASAARLAADAWAYWLFREPSTGRNICQEHLAAASQISDATERALVQARLTCALGVLNGYLGDVEEAADYLAESVALAREHQDWPILATGLRWQGNIASLKAQWAEALAYYEEVFRLAETHQLPYLLASIHRAIASVELNLGHYDEAERHYELALEDEAGLPPATAGAIRNNLALLYLRLGRWQDAYAVAERALQAGELPAGLRADLMRLQASSLASQGRTAQALRLLDEVLPELERLGSRRLTAFGHLTRADALVADRQYIAAAQALIACLSLDFRGEEQHYLEMVETAALLLTGVGSDANAAHLLAAADRVRRNEGMPREPGLEPAIADARETVHRRLGHESFERAYARGSDDELIAVVDQLRDLLVDVVELTPVVL